MRIGVGRVSTALALHEERLRGLGLRAYDAARDTRDATLFVGLYHEPDLSALLAHAGPALLMFCGGDARHVAWAAPELRRLRAEHATRVLAPRLLVPALGADGVDVDVEHGVFAGDPAPFDGTPPPLGRRVYAYCPYDRRVQYGVALLAEVAARLPAVGFYLGRWGDHAAPFPNALPLPEWISQAHIREVYADCACGVRTVARDGFPGTPVEMALMGRPTAHVVDVGAPWAEVAPTVEAMVGFVRRALARPAPDEALVAAARAHVADLSFLDMP